jgi:hypothetical protein
VSLAKSVAWRPRLHEQAIVPERFHPLRQPLVELEVTSGSWDWTGEHFAKLVGFQQFRWERPSCDRGDADLWFSENHVENEAPSAECSEQPMAVGVRELCTRIVGPFWSTQPDYSDVLSSLEECVFRNSIMRMRLVVG